MRRTRRTTIDKGNKEEQNSHFNDASLVSKQCRFQCVGPAIKKLTASHNFRGSGREIEIFTPVVEKLSIAVRNYVRRTFSLPVAQPVARHFSLSLSLVHSWDLNRFHPCSFSLASLDLTFFAFLFSRRRGCNTYTFSFCTPRTRHKSLLFSPPVLLLLTKSSHLRFSHILPVYTEHPSSMATFALSVPARLFLLFPRICGQFGATEPPNGSRENTAAYHYFYSAQSFWKIRRQNDSAAIMIRSLSLSLSLFFLSSPLPTPSDLIISSTLPLYFLVSLSRKPTYGLQFLFSTLPSPSPLWLATITVVSHRYCFFFFFFETPRCTLNLIILSCLHTISNGENTLWPFS